MIELREMAQQVLIIGAGALGTALAKIIPKEHAQVAFWDIDEMKCAGGRQPLETLVPTSHFIFMCVPSWVMRPAVAQYAALVTPTTVVVSLAKGLESPTAKTMFEVCTEVLPPNQPIAIMGGAMLAHEIGSGLPGMAVIASTDDAIAANLMALFNGSVLQLSWSGDARSVALAGVLKNVYAIMLGIGDGLGLEQQHARMAVRASRDGNTGNRKIDACRSASTSIGRGYWRFGCHGVVGAVEKSYGRRPTCPTRPYGTGVRRHHVIPIGTGRWGNDPIYDCSTLEAILVRGQNVRIVVQDLIYKKP